VERLSEDCLLGARPYGLAPTCPGNPCTGTTTICSDCMIPLSTGTVTNLGDAPIPGTSNGSRAGITTGYWGAVTRGGAGLSRTVPPVKTRHATTIPYNSRRATAGVMPQVCLRGPSSAASGFWVRCGQRVWRWGPIWPEETRRNARCPNDPPQTTSPPPCRFRPRQAGSDPRDVPLTIARRRPALHPSAVKSLLSTLRVLC